MADGDDRHLNGSQKATVLMMAMGEKRSSRLQCDMDEDEVEELQAARRSLGEIPSETVEKIIGEYDDKRATLPMKQPQNAALKAQQEQASQGAGQPAPQTTRQPATNSPAQPAPAETRENGTPAPVQHLTNIEV